MMIPGMAGARIGISGTAVVSIAPPRVPALWPEVMITVPSPVSLVMTVIIVPVMPDPVKRMPAQ
jgi:hypothetical protein